MSYDIYNSEMKECPACNGTGVQYSDKDDMKHLCPACRGKGKIQKN